jgi:site-specific DNA-methyltransferase (adenine-specific)
VKYNYNFILGDSCEELKKLESESIDMVLTSPPYDNLRTYEGTCVWNFDVFKTIADELARVLKPGGVIVWVVGDATENGSETGTSFRQALYFKEIGLNIHDTMIWEKNSSTYPAGSRSNRYSQIFEYMFVFSK